MKANQDRYVDVSNFPPTKEWNNESTIENIQFVADVLIDQGLTKAYVKYCVLGIVCTLQKEFTA